MIELRHWIPFIALFLFLIFSGAVIVAPFRITGKITECIGVFCDGWLKIIMILAVLGVFYFIFIKVLRG